MPVDGVAACPPSGSSWVSFFVEILVATVITGPAAGPRPEMHEQSGQGKKRAFIVRLGFL